MLLEDLLITKLLRTMFLVFAFPGLCSAATVSASDGSPTFKLTRTQMKWGERQLKRLLTDRPGMGKYVQRGDPVWNWTVRQFAGEHVEGGIEWNPKDPNPLWDAMHTRATKDRKAYIQVTDRYVADMYRPGEEKSGPALWFQTVFELCCFATMDQFDEVNTLAKNGVIGAEEYAFRKMFIEAVDVRGRVHRFWNELWIPNCRRRSLQAEDEFIVGYPKSGIPAWPPDRFTKRHFGELELTGDAAKANREDLDFHIRFFVDQYNNDFVPWLKERGVPTPTPETKAYFRERMWNEFSGKATGDSSLRTE